MQIIGKTQPLAANPVPAIQNESLPLSEISVIEPVIQSKKKAHKTFEESVQIATASSSKLPVEAEKIKTADIVVATAQPFGSCRPTASETLNSWKTKKLTTVTARKTTVASCRILQAPYKTDDENLVVANKEAAAPFISSGKLIQNPEMTDPVDIASAREAAAKMSVLSATVKQLKPAASVIKAAAKKKPKKSINKGKNPATEAARNEVKQKTTALKQKQKTKSAKSKAAFAKSSVGSKSTKARKQEKRPRDEDSTAIVQVSAVQDIVPHSTKRIHTTSTALATRPMDLVLPPDEWDILESRLRKVNENIERCHRGLSNVGVNVSSNHKQSLEADLRFYSAIKQRLQEQLLVVMQSGY